MYAGHEGEGKGTLAAIEFFASLLIKQFFTTDFTASWILFPSESQSTLDSLEMVYI